MTYGIDVSHYQGTVPWPKIAAEGMKFAIAKATEPGIGTDAFLQRNLEGIADAGMLVGAYHFARGGTPGYTQASQFIKAVGSFDGRLAALDCEAPDLTISIIRDFVSKFHDDTGRPLLIYTGISFWRSHLGNPNGEILGPLWLAYYPKGGYPGPTSPVWNLDLGGWGGPLIWQYGSRTIGGVRYDGDVTLDFAELQKLAGGTSSGPSEPDVMPDTDLSSNLYYGVVAKMPADVPILDGPKGAEIAKTTVNEALGLIGQTRDSLWCLVAYHDRLRFVEKAKVGEFRPRTPPILATGDAFVCPPVTDPAASIKTAVNAALDHIAPVAASVTAAIQESRIP